MFKVICLMEVFDDFVEIPADIEDCMIFSSWNEAEAEVDLLKQQEPANKYEIKELTEEEIETIPQEQDNNTL